VTGRREKIIPALAIALLAAALLVAAVAMRRANDLMETLPSLAGGCGEDVKALARSPDKKYVAAVLIRNCGATTPFATHVNLRETSRAFSSTRYGTIEEGEVFRRKGEGWVKLVWTDATHLVIQCPRTDTLEQRGFWRDVTISYQPYRK
jgi:hypothetical protein